MWRLLLDLVNIIPTSSLIFVPVEPSKTDIFLSCWTYLYFMPCKQDTTPSNQGCLPNYKIKQHEMCHPPRQNTPNNRKACIWRFRQKIPWPKEGSRFSLGENHKAQGNLVVNVGSQTNHRNPGLERDSHLDICLEFCEKNSTSSGISFQGNDALTSPRQVSLLGLEHVVVAVPLWRWLMDVAWSFELGLRDLSRWDGWMVGRWVVVACLPEAALNIKFEVISTPTIDEPMNLKASLARG